MENKQHILYKPIGQIVADDYRTSEIFKNYNIDFYFEGNRNIKKVAYDHKLDPKLLLNKIDTIQRIERLEYIYFQSWPLDLLVDYIEKKHHRFIKNKESNIKILLKKLCKTNGESNPILYTLAEEFNESINGLSSYMKNEELFLFPTVREMIRAENAKVKLTKSIFGSLENPVKKMIEGHKIESLRYRRLEQLTNNFEIPEKANDSYGDSFKALQEFVWDLKTHIHLENNILFLKIKRLEKQLKHQA
ncbi:DUF542 domain-containing protein [Arenibacter sp. ARW7G5Y1]|uniref:DUF542 domain-containing protein n=1 Tax=Arenibacter sp. ARW7G5Y1 TaxID=2135619 RepID=UPI000D75959B|nr:DUF542 domain-containing protein [Arenibacter sp. ARW7G5Y1]PXX31175.1 regulator of cell morphogenesis and NO signaling [Arenibacter sp. ARW7G5Y1]